MSFLTLQMNGMARGMEVDGQKDISQQSSLCEMPE